MIVDAKIGFLLTTGYFCITLTLTLIPNHQIIREVSQGSEKDLSLIIIAPSKNQSQKSCIFEVLLTNYPQIWSQGKEVVGGNTSS